MTSTTLYGSCLLIRVEKTTNILGVSLLKEVQRNTTKGLCGGGSEFKFSLTYVRTLVKEDEIIQDCIS